MDKEKEKVIAWLQQVIEDIKSDVSFAVNGRLEEETKNVFTDGTTQINLHVWYLRNNK